MIWPKFVNLVPGPYTPTRVTSKRAQVRKMQQEMQGFRQQGPASGARDKVVCKEARCWSTHLLVLCQRATPMPFCVAPSQTATVRSFWRVATLLVVSFLPSNNDKGSLPLLCAVNPSITWQGSRIPQDLLASLEGPARGRSSATSSCEPWCHPLIDASC
jgi:hypothetical protein